jgi:hypothetical protein
MLSPNHLLGILKDLIKYHYDDADDRELFGFGTIDRNLNALIKHRGFDAEKEIRFIWTKLEPILKGFSDSFSVCWRNTELIGKETMNALTQKYSSIFQTAFGITREQGEDIASFLYCNNLLSCPFPLKK